MQPSVAIYAIRQKCLIENNFKIDQRITGESKKVVTLKIFKFLKTTKATIL